MAVSILSKISLAIQNVERVFLFTVFGKQFPPPAAVCVSLSHELTKAKVESKNSFSIKDIIGDGLLFAVPKFRRTLEKRWKRKYGVPYYYWKPLVSKNNLRFCNNCGHHHEVGVICEHCYEKIRIETKAMQEAIQNNLGLDAVEEDVIVLYEGEKLDTPEEHWKGKRIVEMDKPRPAWFSKNLLQRTTQQPATSTDVKPTELA